MTLGVTCEICMIQTIKQKGNIKKWNDYAGLNVLIVANKPFILST